MDIFLNMSSMFTRLIKPDWGKPTLTNGKPNPDFSESINGPDVYEGCFDDAFLHAKNAEGYNFYFFPNHPSTNVYADGVKHLSGRHINTFNYVFVDMDLKDKIYPTKEAFYAKLKEFQLQPTMVVSSGNGVHAYWRVTDLDRDAYVFIQQCLINHFNTDDSVYTVLQLMRYPGSLNTKRHKDYVASEVIESTGVQYTISNFQSVPGLFELPEKLVTKFQNHIMKLDGKLAVPLGNDVNLDEIPDRFIEFIDDPKNAPVSSMFRTPTEGGRDRSSADMSLCNTLKKAKFNRKEALAILANTQKALSKGANRQSYAEMTVAKVYTDALNAKFLTVGQMLRAGSAATELAAAIRGTWFMDFGVLGNPWRKKELLGIIAGPGVGKTSVTLKIMRDIIENNPENDDIFIFISLEMTVSEIVARWIKLVGENSPLADRLYVIDNYDEKGNPRNIGLQEILEFSEEIKLGTGKNIGALAVDHIGILSKHIDTEKKYTFGIASETDSGWGKMRTLSMNSMAKQLKPLANLLDTFLIILTQTTKEKGVGDLPIGKDGAYGISDYENIMDRIITCWQPLQRVQNQTKTRYLAWQYVKIRNKHEHDQIQTQEPKLLTFELSSGDLRITTTEEYAEFQRLLPIANSMRDSEVKKKSDGYSIHVALGDMLKNLPNVAKLVGNTNNAVAEVQPNKHT
jgi:hypothetical protein